MNKNQAEGMWEQVKGRAKRAWGELTDDDFLKAEGSVDKLYGVIQEKIGASEETIREKLHTEDHGDGQWLQTKGRVKKAWGELTNNDSLQAEGAVDKAHGQLREKVSDAADAVKSAVDSVKKS